MGKSIFVFASLFLTLFSFAKEIPRAPKDHRWVQDYGNVLDANQETLLLKKLKSYFDSTSNEITIVTEYSLDGEDIFEYSYKLAKEWKIGTEGKDNGILIYTAVHDKKVFIQVGRGLEGAVPDAYAKRIVSQILLPSFKINQYGTAYDEATDALIGLAEGEFVFTGKPASEGIPVWVIILIVIILIIVFSKGGNDGHTYDYDGPRRRSIHRRPSIWIGGGGLGGGGLSRGGGFGGGFGGGSFGGGGAGGSW